MEVLWAQVEAHKAYAGAHEAHVEAHKAHVEAHKAYVEVHKAYVELCRGTQDARTLPGPAQTKTAQGTNTVFLSIHG